MAPSLQHGIHKMRGGCHPLMYVVPMLLESSSSWRALKDNPPSLKALSNYQNLRYQIDLGKLAAIIFLNHLQVRVI